MFIIVMELMGHYGLFLMMKLAIIAQLSHTYGQMDGEDRPHCAAFSRGCWVITLWEYGGDRPAVHVPKKIRAGP